MSERNKKNFSAKEKEFLKEIENLQKENRVLLRQVFFLQEKIDRINDEVVVQEKTEKIIYGAGDQVKLSLSYRVGKVIVCRSKNFFDYLLLPFRVIREIKLYYLDIERSYIKNQPKLNEYADYKNAIKAQQHLSYKIGEIITNNFTKISNWPKMIKGLFEVAKERMK